MRPSGNNSGCVNLVTLLVTCFEQIRGRSGLLQDVVIIEGSFAQLAHLLQLGPMRRAVCAAADALFPTSVVRHRRQRAAGVGCHPSPFLIEIFLSREAAP